MRYILLLGALLWGAPAITQAQSVQGRVTDRNTDEPLIGATLFIPSLQLGTVADEQGAFELFIPQPGAYRLVVSFVGYQSESRTVDVTDSPATLDVALQHTTLKVPEVTITAKALASDILSTPQAVAVLDGSALLRNQGATAFDALDQTAGVRLLRSGPGLAKPVVRGLTSQRVLVIHNGIRQEGQQWGDEHAPELDAFAIDRIEVVKGPASLLYGSDALGGVIQATGDDLFAYRRPVAGRLTVQGLSNTQQAATNLRLGGRRGRTVYEGAFTLRQAGSFDTPRGRVPNTAFREVNGALRLGRSFAWGTLQAEYQHFGGRLGLFEPEEDEHAETGGRFDIGQPNQQVGHDRVKLHLTLPMDGHRLEWATSWQQNRRREFEEHEEELGEEATLASAHPAASQDEEAALFLRLNTVTSDLRFHHKPLGRIFGTIGLSGFFQRNETLAEEALIPAARTWNGSLYVSEEWVLPQLTVSGGLRLDARRHAVERNEALDVEAQARSYTALTGALGLAWQPRPGLSLALNAGRAWRAPVLIELFGNGVHEGTIRFEQGDASLRPEQSVTLESTLRWLHSHLFVEASGFVNHIDHFIFPRRTDAIDSESGFFIYNYEQAAARLWGGEVRVDFHPHVVEWLRLHLAGDVTHTRNLDTDDPLPWSPPARLTLSVEIEQERMGPVQNLSLHVGPTLVARQTRIDPTETPTPGYTLWDASLSGLLNFGVARLTPVIAVDNLFDEAYINHLSRYKPHGVLNPGRNIRFEVQVAF